MQIKKKISKCKFDSHLNMIIIEWKNQVNFRIYNLFIFNLSLWLNTIMTIVIFKFEMNFQFWYNLLVYLLVNLLSNLNFIEKFFNKKNDQQQKTFNNKCVLNAIL